VDASGGNDPTESRDDASRHVGLGPFRRRPGIGSYVLLLGLIGLVCIVSVQLIGPSAATRHFCPAVSSIYADPPCQPWGLPPPPPPPMLPMKNQPPNPCHLLTTKEVAEIAAPPVRVTEKAPLPRAGADRNCAWSAGGSWNGVQLRINTAAALAAAKGEAPLSQRFAAWSGRDYQDLEVGGYPARYSSPDGLEVLTPKVWIYLSSARRIADESALSKLAALALSRVDSTGP
jgi:hypothetical protein